MAARDAEGRRSVTRRSTGAHTNTHGAFWALHGRGQGRAHWFLSVNRLSACGNVFAHDRRGHVNETTGLRVCFRCEQRALEVQVLGYRARRGRVRL